MTARRGDLRHQARELASAARVARTAYGAGVPRTLARALALRALGRFAVRDALGQGLLDPAIPLRRALRDYVSKPRAMRVEERYNPSSHRHLLDDKEAFTRAAAERGLPQVRTIAVVGGGRPDVRADGTRIDGAADWAAMLARDPACAIVIKPVDAGHGEGVRVLERDGPDFVEGSVRWAPATLLDSVTSTGRHIVQERATDHPELQRINPSRALQTARITTLEVGSSVRCLDASVKLAAPDALVDNFAGGATGNIIAMVDAGSGVITELWVPRPGGAGTRTTDRHPRTGAVLAGRRVPLWREAMELSERATLAFAPLRTFGWDVALTAGGPVLVEGNARWDPLAHPSSGALFRWMKATAPRR